MWRNNKVLVIDDNVARSHDLKILLDFLNETTLVAPSDAWQAVVAEENAGEDYIAVFIGDYRDSNQGLAHLLKEIRSWNDELAIILVGDENQAIADTLEDTYRFMVIATLSVPPTYNKLVDTLHRAQLYREAQSSSKRQPLRRPVHLFRSLVGTSREIQNVREMMSQVADKDVSVLITGESGTGKEVVARNLHYNSPRRDKPFVPVNCGAIPAELLESELFGHEKGAFTGAINSRAGRFELAEGGTLFLDEIGDMPLNMQVKILRVLQERCFERVGSNRTQSVDVRIIAATHRNLEQMITDNSFREDLYYRLNVFPIELPSLKERAEDIPLLINELVSRMESEQRGSIRFNSAAIMSLCQHEWSGNVRELANLVERMAIMHPYGVIGVQDLPPKYRHVDVTDEDFVCTPQLNGNREASANYVSMQDTLLLPEQGIDLREYITNLEMSLIQQALNDCGGVVARAADKLCVRRTTLVEKMRKYDMQR
ncbi:sigma-54-dependent transcriptional regulator [Cellvibrio japonicus]|uniref:Regulatory protein n=1 Tax=Cellvibrio japonicus (strain Ueda107) TaxID=498211 RepID=B3PEX8_CELJU|nr:sigma-54 dependent transcriptional regulator [Cellvibrio japonicus]ACE84191.1 regulatory protein [Cellvibrio japonicus Ueda107]QEI12225.1 sigma-54-dependent Fis family transcriptional regulator [Cellvibrio japonicus]QEI15799.1 sigma-54-dependent Fis family transcriptional regulator [Cellvibrio japonicus]QEI19377.1 sigma-54-dependent Fis family transcriptional regulator [Cellvibrio japonicus]